MTEDLDDRLDRIDLAHTVLSKTRIDAIKDCIGKWNNAQQRIDSAFKRMEKRYDGQRGRARAEVAKTDEKITLSLTVGDNPYDFSTLKFIPDFEKCVVTVVLRIRLAGKKKRRLLIAALSPAAIDSEIAGFIGKVFKVSGG